MTPSDPTPPDRPSDETTADPLHDLDAYVALPRVGGLALSPAGDRLVTSVQSLDPQRTRWVSALWEVDPTGERPARRLTRSAKGEGGATFAPDGSVLFVSGRPDPASDDDDDEQALLWQLPAGGGEARVVGSRPGGIGGVRVARTTAGLVTLSSTFPSSTDEESEAATRKARKEGKVSAILHESAPVRYWDHDLGPATPRLFGGTLPDAGDDARVELRDLTPAVGRALESAGAEGSWDLSPDGSFVLTSWDVRERGGFRQGLARVDVATGEQRLLLDDPESEYASPSISPDGQRAALVRYVRSTPTDPGDQRLVLLDLDSGELRDLSGDWDHWPAGELRWTPDGTALLLHADEDGRSPVFRCEVATGEFTRLTHDDFAYSDVQVSPDGAVVYALRTSYAEPARPVRLDATTPDQESVPLRGPAEPPALPGRLVDVETTAEDGTRVRSWLCLPEGASADAPAPLLLWIHGGPLGSWNAWSWRWNPWLAVSRGYAVLLPDPALSTGYGLDFVARGWGAWGAAPYTDLMAATDAAVARDDVDETRTAAMGGSFGGYMANWVAGHTDRFDAIVTHASLWALDQFGPTTDMPSYWAREMTEQMALENSPHRFVDDVVSPVLVIHGDKDYRVPIGEGLRLWAELAARAEAEDGSMPHKFLYFPDENHWVLTPNHAKLWYATVFAFLDHHVLGGAWVTPELLR
ncbi:Dipeptidyl aminopeptidase/acylaminoacyl peptidase [Nocardioides scoriae]|uniref:Dipeptidyl aminopeptidase/acylaminoacyl peptidase n=1 Tax=Nocardioides scoriae TaxID=642780 RepID=A0A1H1L7Q6_9ACTN|nr:alpha/beta fold hydrolase [Nocardioides scoriae]SDR69909.1 Dipeptidyl aminopeptidase/acylaminoacyl peptidase [Nocardioides scoriae]